MEMNSKLNQETFEVEMATKIERNEFFEFINKNLVYRDKLKSLTAMIDNFEIRFNEKLNNSHRTYEQFSQVFKEEWKKIGKIVNSLHSKMKVISEN